MKHSKSITFYYHSSKSGPQTLPAPNPTRLFSRSLSHLWLAALSEPFKQNTTGLSLTHWETPIDSHTLFSLHSDPGRKITDHRLEWLPPLPLLCTLMLHRSVSQRGQQATPSKNTQTGGEVRRRRGADCWRSPRVSFLLAVALAAVNGGPGVSFCCFCWGLCSPSLWVYWQPLSWRLTLLTCWCFWLALLGVVVLF